MMSERYDDRRIRNFRTKIGPKIRDYLVENGPGTILGIETAGKLFAVELYKFLLTPGLGDPFTDVKYIEASKTNLVEKLHIYRQDIEGRNLIVIDDDIHTKQTYNEIQTQLENNKKKLKVLEIKWAVEYDGPGVADWSCNRNGNKNGTPNINSTQKDKVKI